MSHDKNREPGKGRTGWPYDVLWISCGLTEVGQINYLLKPCFCSSMGERRLMRHAVVEPKMLGSNPTKLKGFGALAHLGERHDGIV